ncbi:MAG: DUF177 domain-containing protein [Lachnospiraceae bacterium]|nr:DUF177 domain-containing protein [Lachnospiraceae bacterium]
MLIDITKALNEEGFNKKFPVSLAKEDIELGDGFVVTHDIETEIQIKNDNGSALLITCNFDVELTAPCSRCLKETCVSLNAIVDEEFRLSGHEIILDNDNDAPFIEGEFLNACKLLHEWILSQLPSKVLCKDDCKGLCPVCGQNLNERDCDCDRTVMDPRMEKFKDLFDKFKEV